MSIPSPLAHIDSPVGGATVGTSISFRGKDLLTDLDGWPLMRLRAFSITGKDVGPIWSRILEVACLCLEDTDQAKSAEEQTRRLNSTGGSVTQTITAVLALTNSSSAYTSFLLNTRQVLMDDSRPWGKSAQPYQGMHPLLHSFTENALVPGKYLQRAIAVMPAFSDNTEILVTGILLDLQFSENAFLQFFSFQNLLSITKAIFPSTPGRVPLSVTQYSSWMEAWATIAGGRAFTENEIKLLEHIQVCTSYPDMRIWNNRVGTVTVGARNPEIHGICAFMAVAEAQVYGVQVVAECSSMLANAVRACIMDHEPLEIFTARWTRRYGRIAGYGRPLHANDERNEPTFKAMERLGVVKGTHLSMALAIADVLKKKERPVLMNAGAVFTAILMDLGFSQEAIQVFITILFISGLYPCQELAMIRAPSFFTAIRCDELEGLPT